ncbi:hypothetical protein JHW43_009620 [Diplocarpon mali]|nr:hypothetical protein JHW43_009620 [Diplocarpon mali]
MSRTQRMAAECSPGPLLYKRKKASQPDGPGLQLHHFTSPLIRLGALTAHLQQHVIRAGEMPDALDGTHALRCDAVMRCDAMRCDLYDGSLPLSPRARRPEESRRRRPRADPADGPTRTVFLLLWLAFSSSSSLLWSAPVWSAHPPAAEDTGSSFVRVITFFSVLGPWLTAATTQYTARGAEGLSMATCFCAVAADVCCLSPTDYATAQPVRCTAQDSRGWRPALYRTALRYGERRRACRGSPPLNRHPGPSRAHPEPIQKAHPKAHPAKDRQSSTHITGRASLANERRAGLEAHLPTSSVPSWPHAIAYQEPVGLNWRAPACAQAPSAPGRPAEAGGLSTARAPYSYIRSKLGRDVCIQTRHLGQNPEKGGDGDRGSQDKGQSLSMLSDCSSYEMGWARESGNMGIGIGMGIRGHLDIDAASLSSPLLSRIPACSPPRTPSRRYRPAGFHPSGVPSVPPADHLQTASPLLEAARTIRWAGLGAAAAAAWQGWAPVWRTDRENLGHDWTGGTRGWEIMLLLCEPLSVVRQKIRGGAVDREALGDTQAGAGRGESVADADTHAAAVMRLGMGMVMRMSGILWQERGRTYLIG